MNTNISFPFRQFVQVLLCIVYHAVKAFDSLSNKVFGEISKFDIAFPDYPSDKVDVCNLGVTCPTTAGSDCKEVVGLPIATSFPAVGLDSDHGHVQQSNFLTGHSDSKMEVDG